MASIYFDSIVVLGFLMTGAFCLIVLVSSTLRLRQYFRTAPLPRHCGFPDIKRRIPCSLSPSALALGSSRPGSLPSCVADWASIKFWGELGSTSLAMESRAG